MSSNELIVENDSARDVARVIEQVLNDNYGRREVVSQNLKDFIRVKSKSVGDEYRVKDDGKDVKIDIRFASQNTLGKVRNRLDVRDIGEEFIDRDSSVEDEYGGEREVTGDPSSSGPIMGRVAKPFSHEEADYYERGDSGFNSTHPRCEDCAHYDGEGNCHIVPDIEPEGYCERFYADVGFFAKGSSLPSDVSELNLTLWGEKSEKRLEQNAPMKIISDIKEKFKEKFDERFINTGD